MIMRRSVGHNFNCRTKI